MTKRGSVRVQCPKFTCPSAKPKSRAEAAPTFDVRGDDGALIGQLTVSIGGVRWRPRNLQSAYFADWASFDRVMETQRKEPIA